MCGGWLGAMENLCIWVLLFPTYVGMALALVLVCTHETIPHVRGGDSVDENYRFIPVYVGMTLGGQTNNGFNLFPHTRGDGSSASMRMFIVTYFPHARGRLPLYTFCAFRVFCSSFGCE